MRNAAAVKLFSPHSGFGLRRRVAARLKSLLLLPALCLFLSACSDSSDTFQGYTEGDFVYMASSQAGQLEHLYVQRGQEVAAGEMLFSLEHAREVAFVLQREEEFKSAEALLKDMLTGQRPLELDVTRAQLAQAKAVARDSALTFKRDQSLYAQGAIAKAQLDNSRALADSDAARVEQMQKQLGVGELADREERIKAQEAFLEASRAALAQARWVLEQKSVPARQAGLVYDTMYREGEWVPAGSPVARLLPPQNVYVRFFVPQSALAGLKVKQKVVVHVDGASDIPAAISYISNEAEYTPPVIFSNDTRDKLVYMVEAYPTPDEAARLHPGQPVSVSVSAP